MSERKKMKPVKAWAVIGSDRADIVACGLIFTTKTQARLFMGSATKEWRIARVEIREVP